MADNSTEIARLKALLAKGVRSTTVDGQAVTLDPESIREQIRQLQQTDDSQKRRRPFCSSINLGGCK